MFSSQPARRIAAVLGAGVLALVAACGGGGDGSSTRTSSYSAGPISGFGSIIVNGVRWDDSSARVVDEDGVSHSSSELKLGMVVEVEGGSVDASTGKGKASEIRFGSEIKGPVSAVDSAGSSFTVLGITVVVDASTVFDASITGGLAGIAADDLVEVHGLFDAASNKVTATRVEKESALSEYRMRGVVGTIDTTAQTLQLGTETVSYAALGALPAWVVTGVQAKARLQTTKVSGAWVATKLRPVGNSVGDHSEAEVEGSITAFTSSAAFEVNGLKVDASKATFPNGTDGVVLGAHVEVKGAIVDGVLVAATVKLEDESEDGHGGHGGAPREYELHGAVSSLNADARTFTLRGLTVHYGDTVTFKDGNATSLVDTASVEVKGTLSADGTTIEASLIKFEK